MKNLQPLDRREIKSGIEVRLVIVSLKLKTDREFLHRTGELESEGFLRRFLVLSVAFLDRHTLEKGEGGSVKIDSSHLHLRR